MLRHMIERETAEAFDLTNSVTIEIHAASFRSTRGYTLIAALLDEVAFWRSDDSAVPDKEILAALRPGWRPSPARCCCAHHHLTPGAASWDAFKKHFGKYSPVPVWKAPTRTMNSSVPQSVIDEALEADGPAARAEYMAEFRDDVETFVSRDVVDAATVLGWALLPPFEGAAYVAFVDPSGGSSDSMTFSQSATWKASARYWIWWSSAARPSVPTMSPRSSPTPSSRTASPVAEVIDTRVDGRENGSRRMGLTISRPRSRSQIFI